MKQSTLKKYAEQAEVHGAALLGPSEDDPERKLRVRLSCGHEKEVQRTHIYNPDRWTGCQACRSEVRRRREEGLPVLSSAQKAERDLARVAADMGRRAESVLKTVRRERGRVLEDLGRLQVAAEELSEALQLCADLVARAEDLRALSDELTERAADLRCG